MKSEPSNLIPMVAVCKDGEFLAGKAITRHGWVCARNEKPRIWYCPRCWAERVAVLGVTAEVEQAVEKQQRAFAIEVIAATGAR